MKARICEFTRTAEAKERIPANSKPNLIKCRLLIDTPLSLFNPASKHHLSPKNCCLYLDASLQQLKLFKVLEEMFFCFGLVCELSPFARELILVRVYK